jgi:hypothetical protein
MNSEYVRKKKRHERPEEDWKHRVAANVFRHTQLEDYGREMSKLQNILMHSLFPFCVGKGATGLFGEGLVQND